MVTPCRAGPRPDEGGRGTEFDDSGVKPLSETTTRPQLLPSGFRVKPQGTPTGAGASFSGDDAPGAAPPLAPDRRGLTADVSSLPRPSREAGRRHPPLTHHLPTAPNRTRGARRFGHCEFRHKPPSSPSAARPCGLCVRLGGVSSAECQVSSERAPAQPPVRDCFLLLFAADFLFPLAPHPSPLRTHSPLAASHPGPRACAAWRPGACRRCPNAIVTTTRDLLRGSGRPNTQCQDLIPTLAPILPKQ